MHPILFNLGTSANLYTYTVMLALGYLLGLRLAVRRAPALGLDPTRALTLGVCIILSAVIGAKLLLLVNDWTHFVSARAEFWRLVGSGGVFYGGLILGMVAAVGYIAIHELPLWATFDIFAPSIALGHIVGRLGCFFAGCCYGKPTTVPWAVTFRDLFAGQNVGTPLDVPLHPTQLYEAGAEALILILLLKTESRGRPFPGRMSWLYLFCYAVSRFAIEFFRGDPRGSVGMLSTSQFISLLLGPLAVAMLVILAYWDSGHAARVQAQSS